MKQMIRNLFPRALVRMLDQKSESIALSRIAKIEQPDCHSLPLRTDFDLKTLFSDDQVLADWKNSQQSLEQLSIETQAGGVNLGDRRALFYLIRFLQPKNVLEIGTHIGASTVNIAFALQQRGAGATNDRRLTTVDIIDVNDERTKPWTAYDAVRSPIELLNLRSLDSLVDFVTSSSLRFLETNRDYYDFIFLDGDHHSPTVYQEVSLAIRRLNPGGVILMHDYFPNGRPLWRDGAVAYGPYLAIERLRKEGMPINVLPLGALPWATKLSSQKTSLGILIRE